MWFYCFSKWKWVATHQRSIQTIGRIEWHNAQQKCICTRRAIRRDTNGTSGLAVQRLRWHAKGDRIQRASLWSSIADARLGWWENQVSSINSIHFFFFFLCLFLNFVYFSCLKGNFELMIRTHWRMTIFFPHHLLNFKVYWYVFFF